MRELLFRGQTRRKGEKVRMDDTAVESNWVYGGIFQGPIHSVIYSYDSTEKHAVYSDTVGQYTGLQDKRGQRIFEGDIVEIRFDRSVCPEVVGEVYFINGGFHIRSSNAGLSLFAYVQYCEIIGNIHDNPEFFMEA